MFKLDLEKTEETEIKLPTSVGSWKKQESSRKTSISALLTMPKPLTVDHNKLWKILKEMGIPEQLTCLLRNLYVCQEATVRTGHETTDWFMLWFMGSQRVRHDWATDLILSILWHCLSLGLEWKLTFPSPVATASFPNLLAYWLQHFHSIIFQDLK